MNGMGRKVKVFFKNAKSFSYYRQFGYRIAFAAVISKCIPCHLTNRKYENLLGEFFQSLLSEEIKKYKAQQCSCTNIYERTQKAPIWICWYTGIENSPEIVQACYKSVCHNIPENMAIHQITLANYKEYIAIPDAIYHKFEQGKISPAAFSDIIRACLLSEYGGIWLDATVYALGPIPPQLAETQYFTLKASNELEYRNEPSHGRWCGFIWATQPNCSLFCFLRDALIKYWESYDAVIEYLLPDYIVSLAYNELPTVRKMIDDFSANINDIWLLMNNLSSEYNKELEAAVVANNQTVFYKTTYKRDFLRTTKDGRETLFLHLLRK